MKSLSLLLFLLLNPVGVLPSPSDTLCTICIATTDDGVAAFRTIGRILSSSGFELEDSEEAFLIVSTEIMNMDYGVLNPERIALRLRAEIQMSDTLTSVRLSGRYLEQSSNIPGHKEYFERYANAIANSKNSPPAGEAAWNYMLQVARKYKNGRIKLEK